jgi:hypothetical protein
VFECKNFSRHNRVSKLLGIAVVVVLSASAGCLPDPHRAQTLDLLDQLTAARSQLVEQQPPLEDACSAVGTVTTRLYGEPGLTDLRSAWTQLRDAADALNAACGQATLLTQPSSGSSAMQLAQQRWQQGMQREMGVACDHLRAAAAALGRAAPC